MTQHVRGTPLGRRAFLQAACATSALGLVPGEASPAEGRGSAKDGAPGARAQRLNSEWKADFEEYGFIVLREVIPRADALRLEERVRQIMRRRTDAAAPDQHISGFWNELEPADDSDFLPLITQPVCLELARTLLGEGFQMTEVGARWRKRGAAASPMHVTRPLDRITDAGLPMPNVSFVLAFSWMLNDLTAEMGATLYLPFSHHAPRGPRPGIAYRHLVAIEAPAGSVVIHHGGLWHQFGPNRTTDKERVGFMGGYFPRWMDPVSVGWQPMKRSVRDRLPPAVRAMNSHVIEARIREPARESSLAALGDGRGVIGPGGRRGRR